LSVNGVPTICYAESAQAALAAQFEARALMHERVYQQRHVKAVECMVADALFDANHVLRIQELASR
jgi:HD superfamily phosphohydrolase